MQSMIDQFRNYSYFFVNLVHLGFCLLRNIINACFLFPA
jgi:hypothetical protein